MIKEKDLVTALKGFLAIYALYLQINPQVPILALADAVEYLLEIVADYENLVPEDLPSKLTEWQAQDTILMIKFLVGKKKTAPESILEKVAQMEDSLKKYSAQAKEPFIKALAEIREFLESQSTDIDTSAFNDFIEGLDL